MADVSYAPEPTYKAKDYESAKRLLSTGGVPADKVPVVQERLAEYEKAQSELTQAHGYTQSSQLDPIREAIVKRVRASTKDDTLNSASQLKVFGGQAEYEPDVRVKNPFDPLSGGSLNNPAGFQTEGVTSHAWHEPTVKDFRAALSEGGALSKKAKAELSKGAYGDDVPTQALGPNEHASPKVKDITQLGNKALDPGQLDDKVLEGSEAFKAYRDAAWSHALAEAIASKKPIYRLAFSKKLSDADKAIEQGLDTTGAVTGGFGQSATGGLLDPLQRSLLPRYAQDNRQQRNRHPVAEGIGEVAGAFAGAPEAIARGTAEALGSKLGGSKLGRLATSVGAGAATGAADAQMRSISQAAADALDAGDSAEEMAHKIYDALSGRTLGQGALLGGGAGLAGHAVGSALGKGAEQFVTSGEGPGGRAAAIKQNLDTGGKLDWKGQVKTEPEIENLVHAAPHDMPADEVLARKAAKPMLQTRRLEQEAAHRSADEATATARERLGGQTVPVEDTADRLEQYASSLADDSAASDIRKLARRLKRDSLLSPEELDKQIELMDQKAGYDSGRKLDKKRQHFVEAGRILREDRDSLRFDEPTNAGGFAHRDSRGNVSANTDYSAVKTELSGKQHALNEENKLLGLPEDIPVSPVKIKTGQVNLGKMLDEIDPGSLRPESSAHWNSQASSGADTLPEIGIYPDEGAHFIDGRHRALAARAAGKSSIPVKYRVYDGEGRTVKTWTAETPFKPSAIDDTDRAALAESTEPNVQLPLDKEKEFLGSLQGAGKPGRSGATRAQERLAERSGVSKEYDLIKKMRARQDYRKLLGQAWSGVSAGPGGLGNKFISSNQFLRAVPTLKSFAGGLPKMEASQELVDLLDRHLSQQAGQGRAAAGQRVLSDMVPEAKALNLRGGQPAKVIGAISHNEKGDSAKLSPEEEAVARAVIKNLLKLESEQ